MWYSIKVSLKENQKVFQRKFQSPDPLSIKKEILRQSNILLRLYWQILFQFSTLKMWSTVAHLAQWALKLNVNEEFSLLIDIPLTNMYLNQNLKNRWLILNHQYSIGIIYCLPFAWVKTSWQNCFCLVQLSQGSVVIEAIKLFFYALLKSINLNIFFIWLVPVVVLELRLEDLNPSNNFVLGQLRFWKQFWQITLLMFFLWACL